MSDAPVRPLAGLLIESVTGSRGPLGEVTGLPARAILDAGAQHRVTPALYRRVRSAEDAPPEWVEPLATRRHAQLMRHMQAGADLAAASHVFAALDVPWTVAKGPVAADHLWPATDMREYYDVDVFVPARHFETALSGLLDAGFSLTDRNWPELLRTARAEIALAGPAGTHVDLHWDIAVIPELRKAFRIDLPSMIERSRPVRLASGVEVSTFDPADTTHHLVFHAAQAGANRLMWIGDIHYSLLANGLDHEEFLRRVRQARTTAPTTAVLRRVHRVLESVPPRIHASLPTSLWDALANNRDAQYPFPGLPGDPHQAGHLYSSARSSFFASAGALLARMYQSRRTERAERAKPPLEVRDRVLWRDVPDAVARRAYLDHVRAVDRRRHNAR